MNWMLFILCDFAIIGATFTLGFLTMLALFFFELNKK